MGNDSYRLDDQFDFEIHGGFMSEEIRIKSVGKFTSEGCAFEFEGLPGFNSRWFSWETIASKLLGYQVEAKPIEILPDEPAPAPEKPLEFRVRDRVKVPWSDAHLILTENISYPGNYPLLAGTTPVTRDGKIDIHHEKPVITLVERPKKTVKYRIEAWAVVSFNPKTGAVETVLRASESIARKEAENANAIKSDLVFSYEWIGAKEIELCE